jgi:hypothetical protein
MNTATGAPGIDRKLREIIVFYRIGNQPPAMVHSGDFLLAAKGVSLLSVTLV